MPRRLRSSALETRSGRSRLKVRRKPYFVTVAPGIGLGFRRNAGAGTWVVRVADGAGGNWTEVFAAADDLEDANGDTVLDFWQATDKARELGRGGAGRSVTLDEAIAEYADDCAVRGISPTNVSRPRYNLTPTLLARSVSKLTVRELRKWRNDLTRTLKASSVNRVTKSVKAALNMAAAHDDRITNVKAWKVGLAALPEDDDTESNLVLSNDQRRAVVNAAYAIDPGFGLYVEVHAATGARTSQIALLNVGDLHTGKDPRLMVPSSLKGRNRRKRTSKPMPITASLAKRLKAAAAGRCADQPLLQMQDGRRWSAVMHYRRFAEAAEAAGLPDGATMYCLRHTAITRALLAGIAIRLVASSFDTSIKMIEDTYSKFIADHGDEQMRRAMFDIEAPADGNVVLMR